MVKTGDLNDDFQKSATCLDTVGNSNFKLIRWIGSELVQANDSFVVDTDTRLH